ncbi:MAG: hypothetical protein ACC656_01865 [Candidatus Heimdallarchaeota archaeon]
MNYSKLLIIACSMLLITVSNNVAARGTVEIILDSISIQKQAHPPGNSSSYGIIIESIYREGNRNSKRNSRSVKSRLLVNDVSATLDLGQLSKFTDASISLLSRLESEYSSNASSLSESVDFYTNLKELSRLNDSVDSSMVNYRDPPDRADGNDTLVDAEIIVWGRDPAGKQFFCSIEPSQSIISYIIVKVAIDLFQQNDFLLLNIAADPATNQCDTAYVI